jgi:hypothetical protein
LGPTVLGKGVGLILSALQVSHEEDFLGPIHPLFPAVETLVPPGIGFAPIPLLPAFEAESDQIVFFDGLNDTVLFWTRHDVFPPMSKISLSF